MKMRYRLLTAAVLVLLAGLIVTVAHHHEEDADAVAQQPASAPVLMGAPIAVIRLPLDEYQLTPTDLGLITEANIELIRKCLSDFGIDLPAAPRIAAKDTSLHDRRYGLLHPEAARVLGYRPPAALFAPWRPAELDQPQVQAILGGKVSRARGRTVPPGGCMGLAGRSLGSDAPSTDLAERLSTESYSTSIQHSAVKAVFGRWSECMRQAGYNQADPIAVASDPAFDSAAVSQTEIAIALADIACKAKTGLVEVWNRVEADLQQEQISHNRVALEAERLANQRRSAKARSILGRS